MPGQVKPDFGGLPYNEEPATDPTHEKTIDFMSLGNRFQIVLDVPLYIWEKLKQSDWDQIEKWVITRAETIRIDEAKQGRLNRWKETLQHFARTCVYNQFSKQQARLGNDAWAAPVKY